MSVLGVIEIMQMDDGLPAAVIEAGYRASEHGLVVFVMNNVTPEAINLVLDPVVPTMPLTIPGVLYIKLADEERVRAAVLSARAVFAVSSAFYGLALSCGVSPERANRTHAAAFSARCQSRSSGADRAPTVLVNGNGRQQQPASVRSPDERNEQIFWHSQFASSVYL